MIERMVTPHGPATAVLIGDVNLVVCKSSVQELAAESPTVTGFCTQIARSRDNPGYNVEAQPAAPLKKVITEVGPAC